MDILGHAAFDLVHDPLSARAGGVVLRGYGVSMGGGTLTSSANIAERVLGLPR